MKPNYVARKSIAPAFKFLRVILFWLIIPAIMILVDALKLKNDVYEFYDDKVIHRWGLLSKHEKQMMLTKVHTISVNQGVMGRIFNYGDVMVDAVGKWDISTNGIKNPEGLRAYLEGSMMKGDDVKLFIGGKDI